MIPVVGRRAGWRRNALIQVIPRESVVWFPIQSTHTFGEVPIPHEGTFRDVEVGTVRSFRDELVEASPELIGVDMQPGVPDSHPRVVNKKLVKANEGKPQLASVVMDIRKFTAGCFSRLGVPVPRFVPVEVVAIGFDFVHDAFDFVPEGFRVALPSVCPTVWGCAG